MAKSKAIIFCVLFSIVITIFMVIFFNVNSINIEKAEALESEKPVLLINGEQNSSEISICCGDPITIRVAYKEQIYVPEIYSENLLFYIEDDILVLNDLNQVGKNYLKITCQLNDGSIFDDIILINVLPKNNTQLVSYRIDGGMYYQLAENVSFLNVEIGDGNKKSNAVILNNDSLEKMINDYSLEPNNAIIKVKEIGLIASEDGKIQRLANNENGIKIEDAKGGLALETGSLLFPYKITNQSKFVAIADKIGEEHNSYYYKQTANFTLSGSFTQFHFYGNYNGNNKTITVNGLTNVYSALFRQNYGIIRNLTVNVVDLSVTTVGFNGVLCTQNDGTIRNVSITCPANFNDITYIFNNAYLMPTYATFNGLWVGGISTTNNGTIDSCSVSLIGRVITGYGGITYTNGGTITDCTGISILKDTVLSSLTYIGGVAAMNSGTISWTDNLVSINGVTVVHNDYDSSTSITPRMGGCVGKESTTTYQTTNYNRWFLCISDYSGSDYLPSAINPIYIDGILTTSDGIGQLG